MILLFRKNNMFLAATCPRLNNPKYYRFFNCIFICLYKTFVILIVSIMTHMHCDSIVWRYHIDAI